METIKSIVWQVGSYGKDGSFRTLEGFEASDLSFDDPRDASDYLDAIAATLPGGSEGLTIRGKDV